MTAIFYRAIAGLALTLASSAAMGTNSAARIQVIRVQPGTPLDVVRDRIRLLAKAASGDIVVALAPGRYRLTAPLVFDARDSGRNGHRIIWRGAPGAVLDGGIDIAGWQPVPEMVGVYRARVPIGLAARQLYVNGARAQRARGVSDPAGWEKTAAGFRAPNAAMAYWRNSGDIELVGRNEWKSYRCPVARIAGREVVLRQPCWANANVHTAYSPTAKADFTFNHVSRIENALELLDEPGEWYIDRAAGAVYYRPRAGERMDRARAVVGSVDALIVLNGTRAAPVHDLAFERLAFRYTGWNQPSGDEGYSPVQGTFFLAGPGNSMNDLSGSLAHMPSAFTARYARRIAMRDSRFDHLGAMGALFEIGSQDIVVENSRFADVSGNAISIGETTSAYLASVRTHPEDLVSRIVVRDNFITRAGAEYEDAVGIFGGYIDHLTVDRNDLRDLPYSGISLGWGWNRGPFPMSANVISRNRITDVMQLLRDGGGIYILSGQPGSAIRNNVITGDPQPQGAIYLDSGSLGFTITGNVVTRAAAGWIFINCTYGVSNSDPGDNRIYGNFADDSPTHICGDNPTHDNLAVADGRWPDAARAILLTVGRNPIR